MLFPPFPPDMWSVNWLLRRQYTLYLPIHCMSTAIDPSFTVRSATCRSDGRVKGARERLTACIDVSIVLLTGKVHIATYETPVTPRLQLPVNRYRCSCKLPTSQHVYIFRRHCQVLTECDSQVCFYEHFRNHFPQRKQVSSIRWSRLSIDEKSTFMEL